MTLELRIHVLAGVLCVLAASASAESEPLTPEDAIATARTIGERGHRRNQRTVVGRFVSVEVVKRW